MHEGEKINKRLCKFFIETFEFTDEQLAAIDYQIPMTQEIYDSEYSGAFSITSPVLGNHDSGKWKSANTWYSMCLDLSRLQAPPVAARP